MSFFLKDLGIGAKQDKGELTRLRDQLNQLRIGNKPQVPQIGVGAKLPPRAPIKVANIHVPKSKSKSKTQTAQIDQQHFLKMFGEVFSDRSEGEEKKEKVEVDEKEKKSIVVPTKTTRQPKDVYYNSKYYSWFNNNFKVISECVSKLPNCDTVLNDANQSFQLSKITAETFQKIEADSQTGRVTFDYPKNMRNQMYIQCYVRAVLQASESDVYTDPNHAIKWLTNKIGDYFELKKLGSEGIYGTVFLLSAKPNALITSQPPPFAVMKLAQNFQSDPTRFDDVEIIHELAIGYLLNNLRSKTSCFTYTYGGFYCDKAQPRNVSFLDKDGTFFQSTTISCDNAPVANDQQDVLTTALSIQEKVNGYTFKDWFEEGIKGNTSKDVLQKYISHILIQLAHALSVAQKSYQYVHFDLHQSNVMIKSLANPITITYRLKDGQTIRLNNVMFTPMIIDYGMNCATSAEGVYVPSFWAKTRSSASKDTDAINYIARNEADYYVPLFDMYRFLMYLFFAGAFVHINRTKNVTLTKSQIEAVGSLFKPCWNLFNDQSKTVMKTSTNEIVKTMRHIFAAKNLTDFKAAYTLIDRFNPTPFDANSKTLSAEHPPIVAAPFFKGFDASDWLLSFCNNLPDEVKKIL